MEASSSKSVHDLVDGEILLVNQLSRGASITSGVVMKVLDDVLQSFNRANVSVFILLEAKGDAITGVVELGLENIQKVTVNLRDH